MIHKSIWISLFCLPLLMSCGSDPLDVDATGVNVKIAFTDVNETIMYADSAELIKKHHEYKEEMTDIYAYLIGYCMQIGDVEDSAFYNSIVKFRSDEMIR